MESAISSLQIEGYSLNQTSLEQVFVSLVQDKTDSEENASN